MGNAFQNLVDKLGLEGAKAEMSRRSRLANKSNNKGYFHTLKQEGRIDELRAAQSKGGTTTMAKIKELKNEKRGGAA